MLLLNIFCNRNIFDTFICRTGIISYTEYLFLLSILTSKFCNIEVYQFVRVLFDSSIWITEPQSGFEIAFNMFDTDGNQRVDKNEFLVVSWFLRFTKISSIKNLKIFQKHRECKY